MRCSKCEAPVGYQLRGRGNEEKQYRCCINPRCSHEEVVRPEDEDGELSYEEG